ncbi:MAG: TonB-dependent receptor, partial [Acidobacteriaceae bacterium]|nr:TonB-dependent receptor [Acidobacteriaceae bacterium]
DASTSNFEAELGRASGAVVNVILKSGTNEIHGSAYEFLQNSEFNARSFFNPGVGHLVYNYFGGNVGGPVIKNKLFYFGDVLRVTDHEANTNLLTIPTPAQIAGNLSASTTTIYNPATGNPDGSGRTPFPGNVIQPSQINPISRALLALLPAPNVASTSGTNNYFGLLPYHKDTTSFDVKVDYVPTEKDRLSVRLSYQRPEVFQAPVFGLAGGPGGVSTAFEGTSVQRTYSGGINYDRVFSPTLVAEFRVGVAYYNNVATQADYGTNQSASLGIPGINLDPITSGIVGIDIGSFYSSPIVGYSPSLPWVRAEANIDLVNTWTKILGNHTIKWGGDFRRVRDALLQEQTYSPRGLYSFASGQTALRNANGNASATSYYNNFASFLLDLPNQAGRDLATYFPSLRAWELFAFVQDKWVVTPKLTVDLGLRWEFYPPFHPQFNGGFSNYNPVDNTLQIAGVGGVPQDLGVQTRYKYFAPRLGLAYRITDSTVVRAGFGISYTPFPDNSYAYNYPVRANNVYTAPNSFVPAVLYTGQTATFQNGFPPSVNPAIPANGIIANPTLTQQYNVVNPGFKNPYVESWNLAVQQALPWKFVLDTAYVANHGVDSVVNYNLNAGFVPGAGVNGRPLYAAFKRPADTNLLFAPFSTSYNSLQVKFDRRFSDLNITTAYTFGKGLGFQDGDDGGLYFYVNQRRNYARNTFDRKHTFVQSYVYDLPFGPGKRFLTSGLMGNIFGGWRATGILTLMSGSPFTVTASGTALNMPGNTQTANQIAPVQILGGVGPNSPWFSPSSFAPPTAAGVYGNTGRNIFDGPGLFNLDASLAKVIRYKERYSLEVRGEAFSLTNTPQFSNPNSSVSNTSNFGYVTGTSGGNRTLQLGAKFNF